jgi:type IV pilus assembly protein PilM
VKLPIKNLKIASAAGGRPPAAIEVAPEGILAAASPGSGKDAVFAFVPLASGTLVPSIETTNLHAPDAVSAAIRSALGEVAPRTRAVTLVLPDTLVRVFMLDFDSIPAKTAEAISVVRFRLRKMVPFDVEHAGVSYQVLSQTETDSKVLAAVIPGPVLAEYEAAVRAAGYEPGAVLSSSLAALEAINGMEAVIATHLSAFAMTTTITNGQNLLLYRTLDLPADASQRRDEIQRGIAVAAAYYEDRLGSRPRALHYAGIEPPADFAQSIGDPEISVVDWVPRPNSGVLTTLPLTSYAGVAGALAGARS